MAQISGIIFVNKVKYYRETKDGVAIGFRETPADPLNNPYLKFRRINKKDPLQQTLYQALHFGEASKSPPPPSIPMGSLGSPLL